MNQRDGARAVHTLFDDGRFSGGSMEHPAPRGLMAEIDVRGGWRRGKKNRAVSKFGPTKVFAVVQTLNVVRA
jgi:hypothetical protein